jgi:hypothetical protein
MWPRKRRAFAGGPEATLHRFYTVLSATARCMPFTRTPRSMLPDGSDLAASGTRARLRNTSTRIDAVTLAGLPLGRITVSRRLDE